MPHPPPRQTAAAGSTAERRRAAASRSAPLSTERSTATAVTFRDLPYVQPVVPPCVSPRPAPGATTDPTPPALVQIERTPSPVAYPYILRTMRDCEAIPGHGQRRRCRTGGMDPTV